MIVFKCVFLLTVALAAKASDYICPPTVLIFPCTCVRSTIECSNFDNPEDMEDIFQDIAYLEFPVLRILNSRMPFIPSSIFEITMFREFYLANSTFSSLFNDTPSGGYVENFIIDRCEFGNRIKGEMFSNFTSLNSLHFVNNGMTSIRRHLTSGLPKTLKKLSFFETRLHNLSVNVFDGLDNLQEINIQHGNLRRLSKIKFPKSIRVINLRNNKIEYLPDGIFDGLSNLTHIILENNLLTTLKKEVFRSVPRVFLLRNPMACDCKIKWLVEADNKMEIVNGKCGSPFNMRGREINQLTNHDFVSCFWKTY